MLSGSDAVLPPLINIVCTGPQAGVCQPLGKVMRNGIKCQLEAGTSGSDTPGFVSAFSPHNFFCDLGQGISLSSSVSLCLVLVAAHGLLALAAGRLGSVVGTRELSCPTACGIFVPGPGIEPVSPALKGRYLTSRPPGKS